MTRYRLIARLSPTLVRLTSEHGPQLFTPRKLRKPARCRVTGVELPTGAVAWGEVTSCAMNRADRIADRWVVEQPDPNP